jgi:hypothetical protein
MVGCFEAQAGAQTASAPTLALSHSLMPGADRSEFDVAFAELRRLIDEQGRQIERQAQMIASQGRDIELLRTRLGDTATTIGRSDSSPEQVVPRLLQEGAAQKADRSAEMPAAVVSAGDFPRSIQIPGTQSAATVQQSPCETSDGDFRPCLGLRSSQPV